MIKWNITSRHKPGMTTERFYYEWAVMHVALMLTNASTIRCFRRYVQHFAFQQIPADARVLPQHAMAWESFAEHWIEGLDAIPPAVSSEDYRGRMQPHTFSDSAMELHLLQGTTLYERSGFRSGGVKLIHNLKAKPGLARSEFEQFFCASHAPRVAALLKGRGLRKYELDRQLGLDPAQFKGTLFEKGGVDAYAGLEEFWFDSLEDALAVGRDPLVRNALLESYGMFTDIGACHSMYMIERVAFDFVSREATALPAVMDPASCEARASYADWKSFLPALNRPA
jgi:hypothetical protein